MIIEIALGIIVLDVALRRLYQYLMYRYHRDNSSSEAVTKARRLLYKFYGQE